MSATASRIYDSSIRYELPVYVAGVYQPTNYFKGLYISESGDITIAGYDEVEITIPVTPGVYPFAGKYIVESTTTATISAVLF
jgi:hypothetical protein